MNCKKAILYIHRSLDGELQMEEWHGLRTHLSQCQRCYQHYMELEQTELFLRMRTSSEKVPAELTERIICSLPPAKRKSTWVMWVKRHPAVSTASLLVVIVFGSFLTTWNDADELVVRGQELHNLVIEGHTVTVPQNSIVNSNLVVEHGEVQVGGLVHGNLVVVDGKLHIEPTGSVSGKVKEVDKLFDWCVYKIGQMFASFR